MKPPPKWKTAVLIWVSIYPSITLLSMLFGPQLQNMALPMRTLIMTAILVPLMVFVLLPALNKLFKPWLHQ